MKIILIVFILLIFNNIVKNEVIQFIEWDNITQTNNLHLEFKMGSTVLFSVSNNTGDHNIVIKESFFNSSETLIKSPILNFNNNQIYFIYTFIKDGNYLITDDFSKNSMDIKISSTQFKQQSSNSSKSLNYDSLNNITFSNSSNDNDGISNEISQENENLDFNNFFKDSKEELNDTSSTNLNNKSIYDFFSNFTISSSNSTIKNSTKSKKPTTIIVRSHRNKNPDILLNSDSNSNSNSNSNQNSNQNSNCNSIQPPSIYYLIIYVSVLFIF
ncbi:hypothetical protein ACTFIY_004472 [Dictyostelium cf. discoideum]